MKIEVGKKSLAVALILFGFFVVAGMAWAYNTNNPSGFGHSAGEVDITTGQGVIKTLQAAIDDGDFAGGGSLTLTTYNTCNDVNCPPSINTGLHDYCALTHFRLIDETAGAITSSCNVYMLDDGTYDLNVTGGGAGSGMDCTATCFDFN